MSRMLAVAAHKLNKILPNSLRIFLRRSNFFLAKYAALIQANRQYIDPNYLPPSEVPEYGYFPSDDDYNINMERQTKTLKLVIFTSEKSRSVSLVILMPEFSFAKLKLTIDSVLVQQEYVAEIYIVSDENVLTNKWMLEAYQLTGIDLFVVSDVSIIGISEYLRLLIYCGEQLHEFALPYVYSMENHINTVTYCDTDIVIDNERTLPHFYSDWNPDLLLSTSYIRTGVLIPKGATFKVMSNGFDEISSSLKQEYLSNNQFHIEHIPFVLIHRHIDTLRTIDSGEDTSEHFHYSDEKLVSLIIPTYNGLDVLSVCISSILEKTLYENYEIVIIDNNSNDPKTLAYLDSIQEHSKISVIRYPKPFNYSAINNFAAMHAKGSILGLINNDIEVISPDWLSKMVAHVQRPDIGCVGAKLLYPNELVQHAGVVLGYGGGAGHAHKFFPREHPGYLARAKSTQNFSAVTAACLLVTKDDFEAVGGLNEVDLTVAFNDVDFCLRILNLGRRNLLCAEALLYHHESISRGHEDTPEKQARFLKEVVYLQKTWSKYIAHDPAYNPNLTLKYENFSIKLDK